MRFFRKEFEMRHWKWLVALLLAATGFILLARAPAARAADHAAQAEQSARVTIEETKQAVVEKMEGNMASVQKTIDELKKKADSVTGEAQAQLKARIAVLEAKRDELNERLAAFQKSSGSAWKKLRGGLDQAWLETSKAFREARSEFESKKSAHE
jgi:biopolymer transport protein ExbD